MSALRATRCALVPTVSAFLAAAPVEAQEQTLPPGQAAPAPRPHPLRYVDATGAIAGLTLEGGNTELEMGDVNGDGFPDIASVGDHGSPFVNTSQHGVTLWLGDGDGGWTLIQTGDFGYGGIALGDVNGDGLMDVGYGVHHNYSGVDLGDQLIEVALGDGSGASWTAWDDGLATEGETYGMFATDFADVDGDGDLDVGSNSFGCCAGVHVYLNQGDGTWEQSFGFVGGNADPHLLFCDFTGDGHVDIVVGHQDAMALRGDGSGAFVLAEGNLPAAAWQGGPSAGDVDGDGRDEVAFVIGGAPQVWSWTEGDVWVSRTGDLPASGSYDATQLTDLDSDGSVDLLAVGDGALGVWTRPGALDLWHAAASQPTPGTGSKDVKALRAGTDLDHNGYADVALVQSEGSGGPFGSSTNTHRVLFEATPVDPAATFARVQAPSRHRVWRAGQVRSVRWVSAIPGAVPGTATVELSLEGPDGPWSTLASVPNSGHAQIQVPLGAASDTARVRVSIQGSGGAVTALSAPFRILL